MLESKKRLRGITLIEMVVVVSIIGILVAIAYPQYLDRTMKAKRVDAKAALLGLAAEQEKFFLKNNRFAATLEEMGNPTTENGYYTLSLSSASDTEYVLTATADDGNGSAQTGQELDEDCRKFSINQVGQKTAKTKADADSTAICWQ